MSVMVVAFLGVHLAHEPVPGKRWRLALRIPQSFETVRYLPCVPDILGTLWSDFSDCSFAL